MAAVLSESVLDRNGPNNHFGQIYLIQNRILAFARPNFGPFWPDKVHFGPFRSANRTLAIPDIPRIGFESLISKIRLTGFIIVTGLLSAGSSQFGSSAIAPVISACRHSSSALSPSSRSAFIQCHCNRDCYILFKPCIRGFPSRGCKFKLEKAHLLHEMGHTPSTAGTFRKKFRKNSGKTPETLSERFLEFPSRVRLGCPKPYNSRHLRLPEHFQNSLPPSTAGDASFFRSGSGKGLSEPAMEFPAALGVSLSLHPVPLQ